jgi:NADPH2:quinone reductase
VMRAVLDHTASDYPARLMELTEGRGADVILEMLANVNLQKDLDLVARFGRIVIIGNRGTIEINPRATMSKDATITGLALWNAPAAEMNAILAAITAGLANGTLQPVVGREFPLAEAAAAHRAVLEPGAYGKIVLVP